MTHDPLIQRLRAANPARAEEFAELPALGSLPAASRLALAGRRRPVVLAAVPLALAAALVAAVAIAPSGNTVPGGQAVLERAFAAGNQEQPAILHWTVRTDAAGLETHTEDWWLRFESDGKVTRVRQLRRDGKWKGLESAVTQPNGLDDPRGATDRTFRPNEGRVRTSRGYGVGNPFLTDVLAKMRDAGDDARETTFDGRAAYAVTVREPSTPVTGARRTPHELGIVLWVDRDSYEPIAVRWGSGEEEWMTMRFLAFDRLPDDAEHRALLELSR